MIFTYHGVADGIRRRLIDNIIIKKYLLDFKLTSFNEKVRAIIFFVIFTYHGVADGIRSGCYFVVKV